MARPGPTPKGDRSAITVRMERRHRSTYEQEAAKAGLPLGDYLALVLARGHQLDVPDYLQGRRRRRGQVVDQQELAMDA